MPLESLRSRHLTVRFFIAATGETHTLSGLRVSCQTSNAGLESGVTCNLRISGMRLSEMNKLSSLHTDLATQSLDRVDVIACVDKQPPKRIFSGGIIEAFIDYSVAPDIIFFVDALSSAIPNAMPVSPTSFTSGAAVADIMQAMAHKVGLGFQNHNVTARLSGASYFALTASEQLSQVARATGTSYVIDLDTLHIWPKEFSAATTPEITLSAQTGLIGYPAYNRQGVRLQCFFDSAITYRDTIRLQSQYSPISRLGNTDESVGTTTQLQSPANGLWVVLRVQHSLDSETLNGQWISFVEAARPETLNKG